MTQKVEAPEAQCHLLKLPTELRLMVFEGLWERRQCRFLVDDEMHQPRKRRVSAFTRANRTAILRTSRRIFKEAATILYSRGHIIVYMVDAVCTRLHRLPKGVRSLGQTKNQSWLQHVRRPAISVEG